MASTRTARVMAVALALPFAAALCAGVAQADNGGFANNGSSAASTSQVGGVGGINNGNSTTGQQVANGPGASNRNNTASVNGSGVTVIDQSNPDVDFDQIW
ncbi:hypothetical protein O1L44_15235 [Streptomyces noursei]|uniref:hypothetical protein n=1 Tax=Streptomyces noursei TaxID=1971 RepID=UPI00081C64D7|nr:membrane protein [Streptomyces noursei ATCC 11455]MCZ0994184.1 hypothetical protein [Streptomyces noursei]